MIVLLLAAIAAVTGLLLVTRSPAGRRLRMLGSAHRPGPKSTSGRGGEGRLGGAGGSGSAGGLGTVESRAGTGTDDPHRAIAVIDRAAALLRIGLPPAAVTAQLAEVSDEDLAEVLLRTTRSLSLGDDPATAFDRHVHALPESLAQVLTGLGAVWTVAESAGAPAADVLERYARSRREIAEAERERAVALAGPKATVTVLTWLPAAGLGLALLIGADPVSLLSSPPGLVSIGAGVLLLLAGRLWMRRMLEQAR